MKRVLVTGATGHLGGLLVRELCNDPTLTIRILVLPSERLGGLDGSNVEIMCGDVRDYAAVSRAVKGCDTVFHLASLIAVSASKPMRQRIWDVNVGGTENIARACTEHGVGRLVYTSSSEVFKPVPATLTETSEFDINTDFAYQISKIRATEIVRRYHREGLDTIIVYPTAIIGPHDSRDSLFGQLVKFVTKPWRRSMPLMRCGYNFVDVRDVASGMIAAWREGASGDEYILSGTDAPLPEVVELMAERKRKKMHITLFPIPLVKMCAHVAEFFGNLFRRPSVLTRASLKVLLSGVKFSNAKAARKLNYRPRPLRKTIDDMMAEA